MSEFKGFGKNNSSEQPKIVYWSKIESYIKDSFKNFGLCFTDNAIKGLYRNLLEGGGGKMTSEIDLNIIRNAIPEYKMLSDEKILIAIQDFILSKYQKVISLKGLEIKLTFEGKKVSLQFQIKKGYKFQSTQK